MAKKAAASIVDAIAGKVNGRTGLPSWWERLTPEQTATMDLVWKAWEAGRFGHKKQSAAKAISAAISDIGININFQGVIRWLNRTTR
jgi:hypothetical protein